MPTTDRPVPGRTITVPFRMPVAPFEPNRILSVTLPPSDVPTVLVVECEASPEVARSVKIRVFRAG